MTPRLKVTLAVPLNLAEMIKGVSSGCKNQSDDAAALCVNFNSGTLKMVDWTSRVVIRLLLPAAALCPRARVRPRPPAAALTSFCPLCY